MKCPYCNAITNDKKCPRCKAEISITKPKQVEKNEEEK